MEPLGAETLCSPRQEMEGLGLGGCADMPATVVLPRPDVRARGLSPPLGLPDLSRPPKMGARGYSSIWTTSDLSHE